MLAFPAGIALAAALAPSPPPNRTRQEIAIGTDCVVVAAWQDGADAWEIDSKSGRFTLPCVADGTPDVYTCALGCSSCDI